MLCPHIDVETRNLTHFDVTGRFDIETGLRTIVDVKEVFRNVWNFLSKTAFRRQKKIKNKNQPDLDQLNTLRGAPIPNFPILSCIKENTQSVINCLRFFQIAGKVILAACVRPSVPYMYFPRSLGEIEDYPFKKPLYIGKFSKCNEWPQTELQTIEHQNKCTAYIHVVLTTDTGSQVFICLSLPLTAPTIFHTLALPIGCHVEISKVYINVLLFGRSPRSVTTIIPHLQV